jgi:hypothetical protein
MRRFGGVSRRDVHFFVPSLRGTAIWTIAAERRCIISAPSRLMRTIPITI